MKGMTSPRWSLRRWLRTPRSSVIPHSWLDESDNGIKIVLAPCLTLIAVLGGIALSRDGDLAAAITLWVIAAAIAIGFVLYLLRPLKRPRHRSPRT